MTVRLSKREKPYHYAQCGLDNVWLVGIYEDEDGDPVIPSISDLHEMIARKIATQKPRLTGEEIRFLRTHIGYSGVDFAKKVARVEPETVSRWENNSQHMGIHTELTLRIMVLSKLKFNDYEPGDLATSKATERAKIRFVQSHNTWKVAA